MTRPQILDGLETIVLRLANAPDAPPAGYQPHEWAYVKGLAAALILRARADLARVPYDG